MAAISEPVPVVPQPTEKQLKATLKNVRYAHAGTTAKHLFALMDTYKGLKPSVKEYVYASGKKTDLMQVNGTLPVSIAGGTYNIPVRIWLLRGYPEDPPHVHISPTPDMTISYTVGYVGMDGRVRLPYLSAWKEGRSDLTTLVQILCDRFSKECPVYSKTLEGSNTAQTARSRRTTPPPPHTTSSSMHQVIPGAHYTLSQGVHVHPQTVERVPHSHQGVHVPPQAVERVPHPHQGVHVPPQAVEHVPHPHQGIHVPPPDVSRLHQSVSRTTSQPVSSLGESMKLAQMNLELQKKNLEVSELQLNLNAVLSQLQRYTETPGTDITNQLSQLEDALKLERAIRETNQQKLDSARRDIREKKQEVRRLRAVGDDLKSKLAQVLEDLSDSTGQIAKLNREKKELEEKLQSTQAELVEAKRVRAESVLMVNESAEEVINNEEINSNSLQQQLNLANDELKQNKIEIQLLRSESEEIKQQLKQSQTGYNHVLKSNTELKKEIQQLTAAKEEVEVKLINLKEPLSVKSRLDSVGETQAINLVFQDDSTDEDEDKDKHEYTKIQDTTPETKVESERECGRGVYKNDLIIELETARDEAQGKLNSALQELAEAKRQLQELLQAKEEIRPVEPGEESWKVHSVSTGVQIYAADKDNNLEQSVSPEVQPAAEKVIYISGEEQEIEKSPEAIEQSSEAKEQSPEVIQQMPEAIEQSPEAREQSPEVIQQMPEAKEQSSEAKEQSPEAREQSPEVIQQMPEAKEQSPEVKEQSPEAKEQSPEAKEQSPEAKEQSPEAKEQSPEVREQSPEVREQSPEVREQSPEAKEQSPEAKEQSPEVIQQMPEAKEQSPEVKEQSPEAKEQSSEAKEQSPEVKEQSPEAKEQSPEVREQSPETKEQSPEVREQSPEAKEQSPEAKEQSPEAKEQSPEVREPSSEAIEQVPEERPSEPTQINLPSEQPLASKSEIDILASTALPTEECVDDNLKIIPESPETEMSGMTPSPNQEANHLPTDDRQETDTNPEVAHFLELEQLESQLKKAQEEAKQLKNKVEEMKEEKQVLLDSFMEQIEQTTDIQCQRDELQERLDDLLLQMQVNIVSRSDVELLSHKILGTGSWGYVIEGKFRGKTVAVKCLHKNILSEFSISHLQREINILSDLRHPNLVLFIAAVLDAPTGPMIITELLNQNLRTAYEEDTIKSCKLSILHDVACALNYLHLRTKPIIHRDVSSANVILEEMPRGKWRAKLSDFGSANLVRFASTPGEGALIYAAPEMRVNAHKLQAPPVDVYSYGVVFCEVVTGTFPHPGQFQGMLELTKSQWPSIYDIIIQCIRENPGERITTGTIVQKLDQLIKSGEIDL